MRALLARPFRALATTPDRRAWAETGIAIAGLVILFGPIGFATGLLRFDPKPWPEALMVVMIALPIPALTEEFVFRGWLPSQREAVRPPTMAILLTTLAYSAWHVVQARLFSGAEVFLRVDFLLITVALGLACGVLRYRSGSLWPPILLHWTAPAAWLSMFGGPSLARLLQS